MCFEVQTKILKQLKKSGTYITYHYYLVNYSFELAHLIWAMPEINRFFLCDVLPKGGSNFPLQKYYNTKSKYVSFFLNQDFLNIQGGGHPYGPPDHKMFCFFYGSPKDCLWWDYG